MHFNQASSSPWLVPVIILEKEGETRWSHGAGSSPSSEYVREQNMPSHALSDRGELNVNHSLILQHVLLQFLPTSHPWGNAPDLLCTFRWKESHMGNTTTSQRPSLHWSAWWYYHPNRPSWKTRPPLQDLAIKNPAFLALAIAVSSPIRVETLHKTRGLKPCIGIESNKVNISKGMKSRRSSPLILESISTH